MNLAVIVVSLSTSFCCSRTNTTSEETMKTCHQTKCIYLLLLFFNLLFIACKWWMVNDLFFMLKPLLITHAYIHCRRKKSCFNWIYSSDGRMALLILTHSLSYMVDFSSAAPLNAEAWTEDYLLLSRVLHFDIQMTIIAERMQFNEYFS